ncbi:MAG: class I SAM-dependent methyltransferase [Gemmatimonadota bacterium]
MISQSRLYSVYEEDPDPEIAFLRFLAESGGLPDAPRALDVGCGPGRMLAPLAALGWTVTGLEPDPDYVAAAKEATRGLPNVTVRRGGFSDVGADGAAYDLIAAVNGPFSYLLTHEERQDAVRRCSEALCPGGLLFLHFSNFWWILRNYRPPPELKLEVDGMVVTRAAFHDIDVHAGRFTHHDVFRWTEPTGESRTVTKRHEMAMFGPPEVERLLTAAGLVNLRTFNDYEDRKPAPLNGQRVLITARKPA